MAELFLKSFNKILLQKNYYQNLFKAKFLKKADTETNK